MKTLKTTIVAFIFMLCSNMNATASVTTNSVSLNTDAISVSTQFASTNVYALGLFDLLFRGTGSDGRGNDSGRSGSGGRGNDSGRSGSGGHGNDSGRSGSGGHGKSVPLDGGLGILLLGATAFGVKKLRKK